jgi:hypothetical protein
VLLLGPLPGICGQVEAKSLGHRHAVPWLVDRKRRSSRMRERFRCFEAHQGHRCFDGRLSRRCQREIGVPKLFLDRAL